MDGEFDAQVTATFGRYALVRSSDGEVHRARPFGRGLDMVCGDCVRCAREALHEETHIRAILPRTTALYRANARGGAETIVANITHTAIVVAPLPEPDFFVVDRYLSASLSGGIACLIVFNKAELTASAAAEQILAYYTTLGITRVNCSTATGAGLDELSIALRGATAVLVGQSGVGKSSLIRRLVPDAQTSVGALVRTTEEGRHTTTTSRLYDLPQGGHLIDSPGVRDFAPAIDRLEPRSLGFPDVERLALGCRFLDCKHFQEPDCRVRDAAASGALPAQRYESYRRLRRLFEQLDAARGPAGRRRPTR